MYSNLSDTKYHENYSFMRFFKVTVPNVDGYLKCGANSGDPCCFLVKAGSVRPGERQQTSCLRTGHTGPTPGVMVWGAV
ncbi:hypothetical protein TNCV_2601511 [Trichonephila clavipes]|nr:hypothetical protein TNCV_2601511 [Trichonephila clavipes]